jgi:uncharacterized membrane protein
MKVSNKTYSILRRITIGLAAFTLAFDIVYCWRIEDCTPPGGLFAPFILLVVSEMFGTAAKRVKN